MQCPAIGLTCFNCNKIGHLKAACRKAVVAASTSNTENEPMAATITYIGQVSGNATVILNRRKHRTGKSQQNKLRVKPDKQTFTHI